jgi:uncharacterized membrane protein
VSELVRAADAKKQTLPNHKTIGWVMLAMFAFAGNSLLCRWRLKVV